jgi:hypothetical protein
MNVWVYKVNSHRPGLATGWHFDNFFGSRRERPCPMGGREWIRSPQSWARLRRVRAGDLFLCYQSDERKIYGLARSACSGYESLTGSGIYDSVDFQARGLRLKVPVPVAHPSTRPLFGHVAAFCVPSRGTIHALRRDEAKAILALLVRFNPGQRAAIAGYAKQAVARVGEMGTQTKARRK